MGFAVVRAMSARRCRLTRTELEAIDMVVTDTRSLNYLSRALRLRPGDDVEFFDGHGAARQARLHTLTTNQITGDWTAELTTRDPAIKVAPIPVLARLKGHAEDDAISALSALGFPNIRIFRADRDATNKGWTDKQSQRWRRIAEDSCRQSGGYWCSQIQDYSSLNEALNGLKSIVYGDPQGTQKIPSRHESLGIVIGPEGGLSEEEKNVLKRAQARSLGFGKRTLRARHAASLLPAAVLNHWWAQA